MLPWFTRAFTRDRLSTSEHVATQVACQSLNNIIDSVGCTIYDNMLESTCTVRDRKVDVYTSVTI